MRRILKWFFMLSKRLYKKPSFVVLLVLIPACVFAFNSVAGQDSGFVHIVLAQNEKGDEISSEIIEELLNEDSMVNFTVADTPESALEEVANGSADEAWIFPADTETELDSFVKGDGDYVVSVVTKEQNVSLRIAREKLTGALFEHCAKAYYIEYIRTNISDLDDLSDQQLITYFEDVSVDEDLFVFGNPADLSGASNQANYLTSPIRGFLAILAVICGMAATMYYMQDEAAGTFAYVKQKQKGIVAFGCVATAIMNVAVVLLLSLYVSSLLGNIVKEIIVLLLYTFCCTSFCLFLRCIFKSLRAYAAIIPLLTVVLIGVCPVFFDIRKLAVLQMLFPPTYYVNAIYDGSFLIYMTVYGIICLALCFALQKVSSKKKGIILTSIIVVFFILIGREPIEFFR